MFASRTANPRGTVAALRTLRGNVRELLPTIASLVSGLHLSDLGTGDRLGTVYLCDPFLVHSAQPRRGKQPRLMAQPPLLPTGALVHALARSPVKMPFVDRAGLASDHTSSHSWRTAAFNLSSSGVPSKTTRPCPMM